MTWRWDSVMYIAERTMLCARWGLCRATDSLNFLSYFVFGMYITVCIDVLCCSHQKQQQPHWAMDNERHASAHTEYRADNNNNDDYTHEHIQTHKDTSNKVRSACVCVCVFASSPRETQRERFRVWRFRCKRTHTTYKWCVWDDDVFIRMWFNVCKP